MKRQTSATRSVGSTQLCGAVDSSGLGLPPHHRPLKGLLPPPHPDHHLPAAADEGSAASASGSPPRAHPTVPSLTHRQSVTATHLETTSRLASIQAGPRITQEGGGEPIGGAARGQKEKEGIENERRSCCSTELCLIGGAQKE